MLTILNKDNLHLSKFNFIKIISTCALLIISFTVAIASPVSASLVTPIKHGSEIVSFNAESNQYNNYDYGFSIVYPKSPRGAGTCADPISIATQPTQIIEDFKNNVVYVAYTWQRAIGINEQCSIQNVNLNLIQNGLSASSGPYKFIWYPTNYAFHFATTRNDAEIENFANKIYDDPTLSGGICTIGSKILTDPIHSDYKIRLNDNKKPDGDWDSTQCQLRAYQFIYSASKNMSITVSYGQQFPFGGNPVTHYSYALYAKFIHPQKIRYFLR